MDKRRVTNKLPTWRASRPRIKANWPPTSAPAKRPTSRRNQDGYRGFDIRPDSAKAVGLLSLVVSGTPQGGHQREKPVGMLTISRRLVHGSPAITLSVCGHLFKTDNRAAVIIE